MNVAELITRLQKFDQSTEIAILDGFNGGGSPRTVNLGPYLSKTCGLDLDDIETPEGCDIIILGFGSY